MQLQACRTHTAHVQLKGLHTLHCVHDQKQLFSGTYARHRSTHTRSAAAHVPCWRVQCWLVHEAPHSYTRSICFTSTAMKTPSYIRSFDHV
jgi:hypothetical protein